MQETGVRSLGQGDLLEQEMATHSSVLAWESHGQRSLLGCSPWGCKESDRAEATTHTHNRFHGENHGIEVGERERQIPHH